MALKTTQVLTVAGTAPTFAVPTMSDTMEVGTGIFVVYKNTGTQKTVTVIGKGTLENGDAYPNKVYTLLATTGELWIPLLPKYADLTTGVATVNIDVITNATSAVVRYP